MALEAWLPVGFQLPDGARVRIALFDGADWQICETMGGGRALIAQDTLAQHWVEAGLIDEGTLDAFQFGTRQLRTISSAPPIWRGAWSPNGVCRTTLGQWSMGRRKARSSLAAR